MKLDVPPLPAPLETSTPEFWTLSGGVLAARAPARTDLFTDPFSGRRVDNAPSLLFPASGDFSLQAEVCVEFASTFDAGVLLLWHDPDHWAKLCFEFSPQRKPTVVSVVNRETSDDCNSVALDSTRIHLRVARRGPSGVFHYSEDAAFWHLVRVFRLPDIPLQAGFLVQSPTGESCRVEFREILYRPETLSDIRSGV